MSQQSLRLQQPQFTKPFYIFLLMMPAGISMGFATVTLPYLLTHNGFSVATAAGIVALGVSANIWRFLWGPIADLTLTMKKWFWIGVISSVLTLLLLCYTPLTVKGEVWLSIIVFISQVAATLVMLPIGSFMANRIEESKKGRASGWYQAGNLGGVGLGGGAGLWISTHYSVGLAGIVLSIVSLLFALAILKVQDVYRENQKTLKFQMTDMGKDLLSMIRIPIALFAVILLLMPIGTGAANNLWSAIAADWKTDADTVALVTGIISGIVSAIGCIIGGLIVDRWGIWVTYLGSGAFCAFVTVVMAVAPMQPYVYITGVLSYSFGIGLINAGFSAVLLFAIGKKNAATKYSLLSSLGNIPVVYMTTFDGWAHDKYNSKYMLVAEAVVGIAFVLISTIVLSRMKVKNLLLKSID